MHSGMIVERYSRCLIFSLWRASQGKRKTYLAGGGGSINALLSMRTAYLTDLSDAEWSYLEPHFPASEATGCPWLHHTREVLDAIFYIQRKSLVIGRRLAKHLTFTTTSHGIEAKSPAPTPRRASRQLVNRGIGGHSHQQRKFLRYNGSPWNGSCS